MVMAVTVAGGHTSIAYTAPVAAGAGHAGAQVSVVVVSTAIVDAAPVAATASDVMVSMVGQRMTRMVVMVATAAAATGRRRGSTAAVVVVIARVMT